MKQFRMTAIGLAATLLATAAAAQSTDVGKIMVTGEGDKLGTGLMVDEDTPKAKSTVTKAQIDKNRSSSNPYQMLNYLPGVNATSFDATGLFGGNLRVRGFNSDQMGFTINGAPVNDSGSFSVFPQEYTDSENLCEMFVTQGATDTEAPHIGASGGNVGLTSCSPEDKSRVRVALSAGQLSYKRLFVRGDTGKIGDFKGFLSASRSLVDKWKGDGGAERNHVDAGAEYQLGNTRLSASLLWNRAVNNNFRSLTLSDLATYGYDADFSSTVPQHVTPAGGTANVDAGTSSASPAYYGYSLNPFENYLITGKANIQITPALRVDVEPYFWYGYGTGGTQQNRIAEGTGSTYLHGGVADLNGDGDTLDTVNVYRGSVTQTFRPGVTTKVSYTLENHRLLAGVWFEKARHRQTAPATSVDNAGNIGDLWLKDDGALVHYADGTLYQNRNVYTVSTGKSVFLQDTMDLLNSKLQVVPALSWRSINRDFTNYASSGSNASLTSAKPANGSTAADYALEKTYSEWLPSLGVSYQLTPETQLFGSLSKNFKAPGNFDYFSLANGVTVTNGVGSSTGLAPVTVQQETSINLDLGARYRNDLFKASATAFLVKFKDRIASSFDPNTATTHDWNVGDSTTKGIELEIGTVPVRGFSAYASASFLRSTLDGDMASSATAFYPTADKQFPDTPRTLFALSGQWAQGPYLLNVATKYTSKRYLTFVNDVSIGGYTTVDLNAAYQLPTIGFFKNPVVRLNVSNLLDRQYQIANSGSGSNIAINASGNPQVYNGAPRFTSVTLQSDF